MATVAPSEAAAERGERLGDGRWALAGLVAGLVLVGALLALRLLTGAPSTLEVLEDRLFALLPGRLFSLLITNLQFRAKPLLLLGWVVVQVGAGVFVAVLAGRLLERAGRPRDELLVGGCLLAGLALWLVTQAGVLTAFGVGPFGVDGKRGLASAGWSALAHGCYGLTLALMARLFDRRGAAQPASEHRRLLVALPAVAAAVFAAVTLTRVINLIGGRSTRPRLLRAGTAAADPLVGEDGQPFLVPEGVSAEVTPNADFYVVAKDLFPTVVEQDRWSLRVGGLVSRPLRLTYADLLALPHTDLFGTLECISNPIGGWLISTTRWSGVPLALLLDRVGLRSEASHVQFTTADDYKESLPLDRALLAETLLVTQMNGEPITDEHGFPLRLYTPGRYGMKNPKWITAIEATNNPAWGYWKALQGWEADGPVETMARFDPRPTTVAAGEIVQVGGVAFAGDRGLQRVEVSTDGGVTWAAARVSRPRSPFTWVLWTYAWSAGRPGTSKLLVRAVDGTGAVQTDKQAFTFPTGATGYHTLSVQNR